MKTLPLLLLCVAVCGRAESLPDRYAASGQLIIIQMVSAPFPHPKRADGHQYKDQFFSASEHYSDNTVAIFIPKGFSKAGALDFVVHFHGWKNNVADVLSHYKLIEQLVASERNAILVVPQGPRNASDSFGGKLEDAEGFKRFMAEVTSVLGQSTGWKNQEIKLGRIILSGHSGGYQVISSILNRGGLASSIREVWLFDALYAQTDKFLAWSDKEHGRLLDIYTEDGGTKSETENLMALLEKRGTEFLAGNDGAATATDLRKNKFVFLYTSLAHNDVLDKHLTFSEFLKTSCLESVRTE
jgi:hypothetical protein